LPIAKEFAICKLSGMADAPTPTSLSATCSISVPYASQILGGKRDPARSLAIHILRKTGWRHKSIADLSDEQLDVLEAIDPWKPSSQSEAA
jgi:hypothetical protein